MLVQDTTDAAAMDFVLGIQPPVAVTQIVTIWETAVQISIVCAPQVSKSTLAS